MIRYFKWAVLLFVVTQSAGCKKKDNCDPGTMDCECRENGECDKGLLCIEDVCRGESLIGLSVSDPNARSCEVLIIETGEIAEVTGVQINDKVKATYLRQDPRVAVSFISKSDNRIETDSVQLKAYVLDKKDLEVKKTSCFDLSGNALDGAEVKLHD